MWFFITKKKRQRLSFVNGKSNMHTHKKKQGPSPSPETLLLLVSGMVSEPCVHVQTHVTHVGVLHKHESATRQHRPYHALVLLLNKNLPHSHD